MGLLSINELDFNLSRHVQQLTNGQQEYRGQTPATVGNFNIFRFPAREN